MRMIISSLAVFLALAYTVSLGSATNNSTNVLKAKERIWAASKDRG